MKKTLIPAGYLFLLSLLFFSAAKMPEPVNNQLTAFTKIQPQKPAVNEASTVSISAATEKTLKEPEPTGKLEVSEELYNALADGNYVESDLKAPHFYVGRDIIIGPPSDPCAQDWIDFNNYMAANMAYFQSWANAHCKPYMGCWAGKCVCIAFFVKPTKNCWEPAYEQYLRVFE